MSQLLRTSRPRQMGQCRVPMGRHPLRAHPSRLHRHPVQTGPGLAQIPGLPVPGPQAPTRPVRVLQAHQAHSVLDLQAQAPRVQARRAQAPRGRPVRVPQGRPVRVPQARHVPQGRPVRVPRATRSRPARSSRASGTARSRPARCRSSNSRPRSNYGRRRIVVGRRLPCAMARVPVPVRPPARIPEIARAPIDVGPGLRVSLGRCGQIYPPQTGGHHRCRGNTACELVHAGMDTGTSYVAAQQTLVLR
jgi:hypothetical protein